MRGGGRWANGERGWMDGEEQRAGSFNLSSLSPSLTCPWMSPHTVTGQATGVTLGSAARISRAMSQRVCERNKGQETRNERAGEVKVERAHRPAAALASLPLFSCRPHASGGRPTLRARAQARQRSRTGTHEGSPRVGRRVGAHTGGEIKNRSSAPTGEMWEERASAGPTRSSLPSLPGYGAHPSPRRTA